MSEPNEIALPSEPTDRPGLAYRAARPAEALLGLVFLVSALLKAMDVNSFIVAIGLYGVVAGDAVQTAIALGTLAIESALGMALVLGWRPRAMTLGASIALLLGFSGLILYGWLVHGISDCGCTGPIKMGPGVSLVKNAVLLALAVTALVGLRVKAAPGLGGLPKTVAALLCAAAVAGYSYTQIEPPPPPPTLESGPFAQFSFEVNGQTFDLGKGEYFVVLLSSTCEHCMASVEKLNQLAELRNFPRMVGLCEGSPESIKEFLLVTAPQFPTHPISIRTFFDLIGKAPPRFVLVRDGQSVQTWDEEVPSPDQVEEARRKTTNAQE